MQRFACFLKTREKAIKTDFLCFSSPGRLPCHEIEGRIKRFACFLASPRSAKMRLFCVFALSGENPPSNIEGCMQPFACFSSFRDHAVFVLMLKKTENPSFFDDFDNEKSENCVFPDTKVRKPMGV